MLPFTVDSINRIIMEITSYCNLHCPQCPRFDENGFLNTNEEHANIDSLIRNLDLENFKNLKYVRLEGDRGDCLMHPDLDKFINFLTNKNIFVEIVTNGTIRNQSWYKNIALNSHVNIIFSIDGLADTNHIYRINSKFDKILKNVKAYIESGGSATWKFIVFKHNQHQIEEAKKLSIELGFDNFITFFTNRNWNGNDSWPVKIKNNFLYNIEPCDSVLENNRSHTNQVKFYKDRNANIMCKWSEMKQIYIDKKNTVIPCCMMFGDSRSTNIKGQMLKKLMGGNFDNNSLDHHTLTKIIQNDFFTKFLPESWNKNPHPTCISYCS
jgi:MoaA/NifB/PqqE/SkfB family radical SAM enzyme